MATLLDLFLRHCDHEFSWPRRLHNGDCYQVCVLCGEQYGYNWKTMSGTERLAGKRLVPDGPASLPKWSPRARRFAVSIPIRFRVTGDTEWREGTIENISESGLFWSTSEPLTSGLAVEMVFQMPLAISGRHNSLVFCGGKVMRAEVMKGKKPADEGKTSVGVALDSCKNVRERQPAETPQLEELLSLTPHIHGKCRSGRRSRS